MGEHRKVREGFWVREGNVDIDFVQLFANITDGEFFELIHHNLFGLDKAATLSRPSPLFFSPNTWVIVH
jgi:hypothetical protein